ncbi:MAG: protein kinase [Thermoanaerobaculia bacterium]
MTNAISPWEMLRTFPFPLALEYQRYTSVADRDVVRKLAALSAMSEVAVRYVTFVLTADHLSQGGKPAIPRWLEELKPEKKLTFGKWIEALREVVGLAASRPTFLPEARALRDTSTLDLLDHLVKVRNEWAHPAGAFELVDDELDLLLRRGKPLLAQWLACLGFLARYPLCIAQRDELFEASDDGEVAYYIRRYMGTERDHLDVKLETADVLLEGRPFLLNPSADGILYLWPLVVASDPEGEDLGELFVFEGSSSANLDAVEYVSIGQRRKIRRDQPELHADPLWLRSDHPGVHIIGSPVLAMVHATAVDRRLGRTIGKRRPYTLLQRIASGGMGTVYLAADPNGRQYAVKVLHTGEGTMLRRFEREIASLGRLAAVAGIVGIIDWGSAIGADGEELRFYVMEYAERGDLGSYIRYSDSCVAIDKTQDPFEWDLEPRLDIVERLAAALAGLHEANLVHRDIKPQNVLLMSDGTIRLADLGLIRDLNGRDAITNLYSAVGTNQYMAPEQLHVSDEVPVKAAADIFSFGFLLFELLFRRLPKRGRDGAITDQKALQALPGVLRNLVIRCTNPDPARRYADGSDLKRAIEASFPAVRRASLTVQTEPAGGVVYVDGERRRVGEKLDLPSGAHVLAGALGDLVCTTKVIRLPPLADREVVLTLAGPATVRDTGAPADIVLRYLARIDARVFTRSVGYGTVRDLEDRNSYAVWQELRRDFGNSPIAALLGVLQLSDADVRMKALRLLLYYAIDDPEAVDHGAVQQSIRSEEVPLIVMLWVDYLQRTPQTHWPLLIDLLTSEAGRHLAAVPQGLRRLGQRPDVVEALVRVMPAIRDAGTRAETVRSLGGQHPRATATLTEAALHDVSTAVREAAIWALAKEPPAEAFDAILGCLRSDASYSVRVAASRALLGIDRERAGTEFAKLEADSGVKTAVAEAMSYES